MTIEHHPADSLLAHFAAGSLEQAEHIVVAAHVSMCGRCRRMVSAFERLGGVAVESGAPAAMSANAFDAVMARIDLDDESPVNAVTTPAGEFGPLPRVLNHYEIGPVKWVAPGVSMRPIQLSGPGRARAFLLRSAPGTKMLEHTHTETELTCVLEGSFDHEGGHFGPGDFDLGDPTVDHRPIVGTEGPCLCLVAMTGKLRINGLLGRLIEPLIRL
jgi:putative transcriptional regulator